MRQASCSFRSGSESRDRNRHLTREKIVSPKTARRRGRNARNTTGSHRQSLTKKAPQKKSCGAFLVGVTVILEVREAVILQTKSYRGELPVFLWNTTGSHRESLAKKAPQKKSYGAFLVGVTVILEVREVVILQTESHRANFPCSFWNTTGSHREPLTKKAPQKKTCGAFLVGVTGFEPAASWSRTKRSTKLSHTPFCSEKIRRHAAPFSKPDILYHRKEKKSIVFSEKAKIR